MPRYEELRRVLGSPYRSMSSEQIERMMESFNADAEDMENFLSTLGNLGRSVVNALPQVLPAALPLVGTVVGGPVGGMIGGVAGQAVGSLLGPRQAGQQGRPGAPQRPGQPLPFQAPAPPGGAVPLPVPAQIPGGAPAAGQLLQTLFRPETLQALISMLLGQAGRQNIPVGNTQVPVGAFTNLLGVLANQAAAEYNAGTNAASSNAYSYPRYMENYAGEAYGDPAIPEHRAEALLNLLRETDVEQDEYYSSYRPAARYSYESEPEWDEALYDEASYDEMYGAEIYGEYEYS
jgi:hypothetical protein